MIDFCSNCGHIDVLRYFMDDHKFCTLECLNSFKSFLEGVKSSVVF